MHEVRKRIGLLDHMGGGNLGDAGTLDAVIQNIKARWPDSAISGFSMNPEDTRTRHGIAAYAIRRQGWSMGSRPARSGPTFKQKVKEAVRNFPVVFRLLKAFNAGAIRPAKAILLEVAFLAKCLRIIRVFDLLIITGGGQLLESSGGPWAFIGGTWGFPYTIFKWVSLAKLTGVECMLLNVGAGPLVRPLSKYFVKKALCLAGYVSLRDQDSTAVVRSIGFKGEVHVFPDTAYSLGIGAPNIRVARARDKTIVGVAPMAYGDPRLSAEHDPVVYNRFVHRLGAFCAWLMENGYCVTLFCSDIYIDPPVIQDLEAILRPHCGSDDGHGTSLLYRVHQGTTQELLANMAAMDYVVVCRFHAAVFAHMLNIPTLAISHHPKVRALMKDLGLVQYCVDIESCDLSMLREIFLSLLANRDDIKRRMAERLEFYKEILKIQFDGLFVQEERLNTARSGDN